MTNATTNKKEAARESVMKFLKATIEGLLNEPDKVRYKVAQGETMLIEVLVPKAEISKVIGKGGKHARSIIILALGISSHHGVKSVISIQEG